MTIQLLPHGYTPRFYQRDTIRAHFVDGKRYLINILHRRAGKTLNSLNFVLAAAHQRVGNYFILMPELKQAKSAVWYGMDKTGRRFMDYIPRQLIHGKIHNTEMRINFKNGSALQLGGSDRYNKIMGSGPVGLIMDEYSLQNPFAWHYLAPILDENNGWALFTYTPRGANAGLMLYERNLENPDWFVQKLDITQTRDNDGNRIVTDDMIEKRRREGMPEELIQQEYFVDFSTALAGAYYSKDIERANKEKRVLDFPIDFTTRVHTAWDIGRRDSTSIWFFQFIEGKIKLIQYYENCQESLDFYITYLGKQAKQKNWQYGMHFFPHDIRVTDYTADKSRLDIVRSRGLQAHVAPKLGIMEGIDATKRLFKDFIFHKSHTQMGLDMLKQYKRDDKGTPVHDFASHPADALRTLAVGWLDCFNNDNQFGEVRQSMPRRLDLGF